MYKSMYSLLSLYDYEEKYRIESCRYPSTCHSLPAFFQYLTRVYLYDKTVENGTIISPPAHFNYCRQLPR